MNSEFGIRLKKLRKKNNLSQEKLASILKITAGAVGNYERGEREPNIDTLILIARYFDVNIDYLVGESNYENPWEILVKDIKSKKNTIVLKIIESIMKDNTLYNINKKLLDVDRSNKELISKFIELIKQYK